MKKIKVKINFVNKILSELPSYETKGSAGMDIKAAINKPINLKPGERKIIPSGLQIEIPEDYEIQIRPRSGLAIKYGITVLNSPGTIDSDYRGEIGIILINLGEKSYKIMPKDRIAQMIFNKIIKAEVIKFNKLSITKRGDGGYGSTGKK